MTQRQETETERHRQTQIKNIQTQSLIKRHIDTETGIHRDRQSQRQPETETKIDRHKDRHRHTGRAAGRYRDLSQVCITIPALYTGLHT